MPSSDTVPVSLSEILETRRGPLGELDIWALLCSCAQSLQDVTIQAGQVVGGDIFRHIVTPNSLLIKENGAVLLTEVISDLTGSLYLAPEVNVLARQLVSDAAFEKVFVFSLGRTLQVASEFGLTENEILGISYDLDSLLQAMCDPSVADRLSLMNILDACTLQLSQTPNRPTHSETLCRLYRSVLSSSNSAKSSFQDSNYGSGGSHETSTNFPIGRARRPRPRVRNRHELEKSRSRTRSRSRSQNRNQGSEWNTRSLSPAEERVHLMKAGEATAGAFNSAHLFNFSSTSSESGPSRLGTGYVQAPPRSAAARSVQGLLGLRQGSPAYQKYIHLKERQIRNQQARFGHPLLHEMPGELVGSPLLSQEMIDSRAQNQSMASLMSYTLGAYRPNLPRKESSEAMLNWSKEMDSDVGSQLSFALSGADYVDSRLEAMPAVNQATAAAVNPVTTATVNPVTAAAGPTVSHNRQQDLERHHQQRQQHPLSPEVLSVPASSRTLPQSTAAPVRKQRELVGSEYVNKIRQPATSVTMPLPADSARNSGQMRNLTVIHLTGQRFAVLLDPHTTGQQLFLFLVPHLSLDDVQFFGLTYMSEGEHFFLDADTKVYKVAPESWKDGARGQAIIPTFNLYIRVKFYPDSLADFSHASSYHLLYLQLRRDVVEERVTCPLATLVHLAGLAMQAEFGDHDPALLEAALFMAEHYLSSRLIRRNGAANIEANILNEHKKCRGIPDSQAEVEFIKCVRLLPEYGIHFYKLYKNKSNTDTYIWVGLSQHSMMLAEPDPSGRVIMQDYPWSSILKLSFNRRRFSIQPKIEVARRKPAKINFYTSSYRKGRYLLQFSTDLHRFQIRMRTRLVNPEQLSEATMRTTEEARLGEDVVSLESVHSFLPHQVTGPLYQSHQMSPTGESQEVEGHLAERLSTQAGHPLRYQSPPPYKPPRLTKILGSLHMFPEVISPNWHASSAGALTNPDLDDHKLQALLDSSSISSGQDSAPTSEKSEYEETSPNSPMMSPRDLKYGRRVFEVTLEKEGKHGIGLTIVGGETTSSLDLGIFVKSIVPGGPADRDGRIQAGDRLIAIGGASLEGKQHSEAVAMIRKSGPKITLFLSQIRPPGTIKKRNLSEEQVEFEKKLRNSLQQYDHSNPNAMSPSIEAADLENDFSFDDFVDSAHATVNNYSPYDSINKYPIDAQSVSSSISRTFHRPFSFPGEDVPVSIPFHSADNKLEFSTASSDLPGNLDSSQTPNPDLLDYHRVAYSDTETDEHRKKAATYLETDVQARQNMEILQKLREEQEITLHNVRQNSDWSSEGVPSSSKQEDSLRSLVGKDREDLQLLGDIAALDATDSSSDSDFDTAMSRTMEGTQHRYLNQNSAITRQVVLSRQDGSVGIITHTPEDAGCPPVGVYVKEVLSGSSAEQEGVLAGDRILAVSGQDVEISDGRTVQALLSSVASDPVVLKISRPWFKDATLAGKSGTKQSKTNNAASMQGAYIPTLDLISYNLYGDGNDFHADPLISRFITSAPREKTRPINEQLKIVPPPPPLAPASQSSGSSTQSDLDSDIFDSSRSELLTTDSRVTTKEVETISTTKVTEGSPLGTPKLQKADQLSMKNKGSAEKNVTELEHSSEARQHFNLREVSASENSFERYQELVSSKTVSDQDMTRTTTQNSESPTSSKVQDEEGSSGSDSNKVNAGAEGSSSNGVEQLETPMAASSSESKEGVMTEVPATSARTDLSRGSNSEQVKPEILDVRLTKGNSGFGFTVAGGVTTGGCYIKQLISEPALSDGRLQAGDRLIKVNSQDMTSLTHTEAVSYLRKLPEVADMRLLRLTLPGQEDPHKVKPGYLRLELTKSSAQNVKLGIQLAQRLVQGQRAIFVKSIQPGGIASMDGRLQPGDRIIQVNDVSCVDIMKAEAVSYLKEFSGSVVLLVTRSGLPDLHQDVKKDDNDARSEEESTNELHESSRNHGLETIQPVPETRQDSSHEDGGPRERYFCPRLQKVDVPVIMNQEWLRDLPLLKEPKGRNQDYVVNVLQELADLVQAREYEEEFRDLQQLKINGSSLAGSSPQNKPKNRYRNVLPYDQNRVQLQKPANDYINASHISLSVAGRQLRYIACQAPTPQTLSDFWFMVWQERVSVIVMLTQLTEAGKVKCHPYWPQTKAEPMTTTDGSLKVSLIRSYQIEDFRIVQVSVLEEATRQVLQVTQIQFVSWPDHGAPETALPLLKLLQVVHLLENGSPALVHCSAGIGRTGSLITMDAALATIEEGLELDMYKLVQQLRAQRQGMIQTTEQYLLCYTACMEALLSLPDLMNLPEPDLSQP